MNWHGCEVWDVTTEYSITFMDENEENLVLRTYRVISNSPLAYDLTRLNNYAEIGRIMRREEELHSRLVTIASRTETTGRPAIYLQYLRARGQTYRRHATSLREEKESETSQSNVRLHSSNTPEVYSTLREQSLREERGNRRYSYTGAIQEQENRDQYGTQNLRRTRIQADHGLTDMTPRRLFSSTTSPDPVSRSNTYSNSPTDTPWMFQSRADSSPGFLDESISPLTFPSMSGTQEQDPFTWQHSNDD